MRARTWAALALVLALFGCRARAPQSLVLASTTSTEDSGLFDVLLPAFERAHPAYRIKLVAVGSGEALALGRRRDADVLLVHSPAAEKTFMADGHGVRRLAVMYNDFVLVGDSADRARTRGLSDIVEAFRRIAHAHARFAARGDQSGTHVKELALWREAGLAPASDSAAHTWYVDVGQGMGETLRIASETGAYTLTDRGTYLALRNTLHLVVLVQGDPRLRNPYSVIEVRGARNAAGARAFADWIVSPPAQQLIGALGRDRFAQPLFIPDASRP